MERFRVRGERRDRYRLAEDVSARAFRAQMAEFASFHALAEQGLEAVGGDPERRGGWNSCATWPQVAGHRPQHRRRRGHHRRRPATPAVRPRPPPRPIQATGCEVGANPRTSVTSATRVIRPTEGR
ncbi:hypothetical protein ACFSTC_32065 [Nonomuraea ferruginea]